MKLIICEKNIAAKRIAYILSGGKSKSVRLGKTPVYEFTKDGETCKVVGLRGHIINLDYPAEFNQWNRVLPRKLIDIEPCKKVSERNIAAYTTKPVIGVPVSGKINLDSILSIIQMPPGIPVAAVGLDRGDNAALLAVAILSVKDEKLMKKLEDYRERMRKKSLSK